MGEMIFAIFLLVMFVRIEADAQERAGIPSNPGRSLSTEESLVSKADVRRNLRSVFDKLMQKTGVNKMEDFIKVEPYANHHVIDPTSIFISQMDGKTWYGKPCSFRVRRRPVRPTRES